MTIRRWEAHEGDVLESANGFDVIECRACRFRHIVPIPTNEELARLYKHEYYAVEKPLYIERHLKDREWWDIAYGDRYDTFEAELPAQRRRLLDVGSGPGLFLEHGLKRGWKVVGCEPSEQAAAHARSLGAEIVQDFLTDEVAGSLGQFDVVNMSEVLEHIPDPGVLLRRSRRLLAPGGILCVLVPNDFSPFQRALRAVDGFAPWWVAPPHHINYFDFESLAGLVRSCGFEIVRQEATFPIDLFLLMGRNYVGNDTIGRESHGMRMRFERTLASAGMNDLRRSLYVDFARHGIGREVLLFARAT